MPVESSALGSVDGAVTQYDECIREGIKLQKELEQYYVVQEAFIRKRVALLDTMQSTIADERRCLEAQHQECRHQISAARRSILVLQSNHGKVAQTIQMPHNSLNNDEKDINAKLEALSRQLQREDNALTQALDKCESLEKQEKELADEEMRLYSEEQQLESDARKLKKMSSDVDIRRQGLERRNETILEWDRKLESRERDLVRLQDQLVVNLREVVREELELGITHTRSIIAPTVSPRVVMDNNDMEIQHDEDREEINLDE